MDDTLKEKMLELLAQQRQSIGRSRRKTGKPVITSVMSPTFDFASLYPSTMMTFLSSRRKIRVGKIKKIKEKLNVEYTREG